MPAFRINGRVALYFHAAANHCSFFPGAHPIQVHAVELADYSTSKGTIRFSPNSPLPEELVRKLVETRIAEFVAMPVPRKPAKRRA